MVNRVKICGITSVDDALMVTDAGADAIGLNFVAGPRKIDGARALEILAIVPPFTTVVALVNAGKEGPPDELLDMLAPHWVSHVQMYGDVTAKSVVSVRRDGMQPIYVAQVAGAGFAGDVQKVLDQCGELGPAAIMLDAYDDRRFGGTGRAMDWELIRQARESGSMDDWPPIILAGGLHPGNVVEAITVTSPWGVDVASGVESSPGRKDAALVEAFIKAVRSAA